MFSLLHQRSCPDKAIAAIAAIAVNSDFLPPIIPPVALSATNWAKVDSQRSGVAMPDMLERWPMRDQRWSSTSIAKNDVRVCV